MIPARALDELRARHPCDAVAGQWVKLRKRGGRRGKSVGPCPFCSDNKTSKTAARFEADALSWVCAVCPDGGDVIRLVAKRNGLDPERDFLRVVDLLGGVDVKAVDPAEEAAAEAERERKRVAREADNARYRERERNRLWAMWERGASWRGTPVEEYLRLRLGHAIPRDAGRPLYRGLRYLADGCLFADGGERAELVHRGPTMLAPIVGNDGRFAGLHMTFLDLRAPKGKVVLEHNGDALPAKKTRGSKAGGHIELIWAPAASRLVLGEGIEKVLAVWLSMVLAGRDVAGTAFWTSVDLGNLGGRALETVPHPTLKTDRGRAQRVPGAEPDLDAPSIAVPDSVTELLLLGDSTSDSFLTKCTLDRAAARYARADRVVRQVWAPPGADFDDVLREAA